MTTETAAPQQPTPVEVKGVLASFGMPADDMLEFHPADGSTISALSIDPTIFGFPTKSALHWAAMLESPVILQLKADPKQPDGIAKSRHNEITLVSFQRADSRTIAQELYDHLNGVALIPRLQGLINYRVTDSVPSIYSNQRYDLVDLREITVWKDDSVTITEYKRSPFNGAIGTGHLLPPLQSIRETLDLPQAEDDASIDDFEANTLTQDMIDFNTVLRANNALLDRLNSNAQHHAYPMFRTMLRPAAAAAYQYQKLIIEFMKSGRFPDP